MKKNQDICEEEQETEVTRVKRYYKATVIGSIETGGNDRPVKQNRKSRNKPTQIYGNNLW